jgi:hypothetical protein
MSAMNFPRSNFVSVISSERRKVNMGVVERTIWWNGIVTMASEILDTAILIV